MTTSTLVERRGRRARRTLLVLSTILASGLAIPALAQSSSPHPNVDANGVDLTTGMLDLELPVGSIGAGAATLPLVAYSGTSDNWTQLTLSRSVSQSGVYYAVGLGRSYDNFSSASGMVSTRGTGATLSEDGGGSFTYRSLAGETIVFSNPAEQQGGTSNLCDDYNTAAGTCTALATSIAGRTGMTVTMDWTLHNNCRRQLNADGSVDCTYSWRPGSVTNSAGYAIGFAYASDTVSPQQNAGPAWYRRTSASFVNGVTGAVAGVASYANPSANVYTITTPGGRVWTITGQAPGITAVQRSGASGASLGIVYGGYGQVSQVTRGGVTTGYSRSVSGTTATMVVTDAQNHGTTVVSDLARFRPVQVTDALNRTTSYGYDAAGRPTGVTHPEGDQVRYGYDARGNLTETRVKAKPGTGLADLVTSALYPASCTDASCNEPVWTRDAQGNQTDYGYDADGLVTSVTAPAASAGGVRPQVRYSYGDVGGVALLTGVSACRTGASCAGSADEVRTTIGYDASLQAASVTRGSGDGSLSAATSVGYDAWGDVASVDGPLAGPADTTVYRYDGDRLAVGMVSADPDGAGPRQRRAVRASYNGNGDAALVEAGTVAGTSDGDWSQFVSLQQAATGYDGYGRATSVTLSAGGTAYQLSQTSYDAVGRVECVAQRLNAGAFGSLPGSACSLGAQGAAGPDRIVRTGYDAAGEAVLVTRGYGTADASTEQAGYGANGETASVTDANGNVTGYGYDGFGRLQTTTYPGGSYESLGYDANGAVTSRRLRDGQVIGYGYDALGRLVSRDLPDGSDQPGGTSNDGIYGYDLLGRLTYASDVMAASAGLGWSFGYDALGRRTSEALPFNGTFTTGYDAAGRRVRVTWPDGLFVTYEYDASGAMTAIRENGGLVLASFGYDDLGRRTRLVRGNGTVTTYGYDGASRLTGLVQDLAGSAWDQSVTLGYNAAGQIASRTGSNDAYAWTGHYNRTASEPVDGLNRVSASGTASIGYDARGNVSSIGGAGYGYNSRNRLNRFAGGYIYNTPLDELFDVSTEQRQLMRSGGEVLTELGYDGQTKRRYVWGPGTDEPLVWYEGAGTGDRRYLHADERGSIVAVSNDAGNAIAINTYDEYGMPGAGNIGRFQYTGQQWLPDLGLYDYKARMYSPKLGRFMQTDPIGYGDGLNLYGYVGGDPVNFVDPLGLDDVVITALPCPEGTHREKDQGDARGCVQNITFTIRMVAEFIGGGGLGGPNFSGLWSDPPVESNNCSAGEDNLGSKVVDRVGDAHGSVFAVGQTMASDAGNKAGAAAIGRAALPGAILLGGLSEGISAASDRADGMSAGRAGAIHGTGFVGGLLGGFALGELVEPLGGGIVGAIAAGLLGSYGGAKVGEAVGAAAATRLGSCK